MKPPKLGKLKIRRLHEQLLGRQFAIPKLQRNFVWDSGRAAKLLDSICRDMPIGSLFLWEMDRRSANLIRQSAEVLPSFNTAHKNIWFVIDGQQRLSVIYQAFEAQERQNDAGRRIDFSRLCFVVNPKGPDIDEQRVVYRKPAGRELVPVRDILANNWKRRMPSKAKGFLARVGAFRERVLNYPVPTVTVQGATLDEIGEVFIRVNSQGMRITSADRAIALMGKLDVRLMAEELRLKVRESGFALMGVESILMGFNLIAEEPRADGDPPKLDAMARRWSKRIDKDSAAQDQFKKVWHKYQHSYLAAIDYLRKRFPVHDESYLPSVNMLSTLSVFFYHHAGQPNGYQSSELRKWFWATGVAERYTGRGYHRNIVADAKLFAALGRGVRRRFVFRDLLDPILDIQGAEYTSRSARTRAFFCLLSAREPRYLENGEEISLEQGVLSHANLRNRHHIFPQGRLRQHFPARTYNSLCNICFLVSRDNQKIGMRLPRYYLENYRDSGRARFKRVMRSHLIPVADDSGIWDRGLVGAFKKFQKNRLGVICAEFERVAGIRLFRKN